MKPDHSAPYWHPRPGIPSPRIIAMLRAIGDDDLEKPWAVEIIKAAYRAEQSDCDQQSDQSTE